VDSLFNFSISYAYRIVFLLEFTRFISFQLSWLKFSYKLIKMLSVCVDICLSVLIRVKHIVTAAYRDL